MLAVGGRYFSDSTYVGKPGEFYEYSNTATALAGCVVAQASGMGFSDFVKTYILTPLGMTHSGWDFSDVNFEHYSALYANPKSRLPFYSLTTYPDGNFITSADDMSKYMAELVKGYLGKGKILSKSSYAEYFRPQLKTEHFKHRNTKNPYNESYNVGIFYGFWVYRNDWPHRRRSWGFEHDVHRPESENRALYGRQHKLLG